MSARWSEAEDVAQQCDEADNREADDQALINAVMVMPFDDLLAMALQEDEIDAMPASGESGGDDE